jgi:hypothetical protein
MFVPRISTGKQGARYIEISGYVRSATSIEACFRLARIDKSLANAGTDDIDYISAYGPGDPRWMQQGKFYQRYLATEAYSIPVSSIKGVTVRWPRQAQSPRAHEFVTS